jgi:hypothetical protein
MFARYGASGRAIASCTPTSSRHLNPSESESCSVAERQHRRGAVPVRLVLTGRALEDPIHGQGGVYFESRRLQHLVVPGADELAICRGCYEVAVLVDLEQLL